MSVMELIRGLMDVSQSKSPLKKNTRYSQCGLTNPHSLVACYMSDTLERFHFMSRAVASNVSIVRERYTGIYAKVRKMIHTTWWSEETK